MTFVLFVGASTSHNHQVIPNLAKFRLHLVFN